MAAKRTIQHILKLYWLRAQPTPCARNTVLRNELKLAKNIVLTNFNDTLLLVLAKKGNIEYDRTFFSKGHFKNLDSSNEPTDETSEVSLRDYFHLNKAVVTPNLCENLCAEDTSCDEYAFKRFKYKIPTPTQNWSGRLESSQ